MSKSGAQAAPGDKYGAPDNRPLIRILANLEPRPPGSGWVAPTDVVLRGRTRQGSSKPPEYCAGGQSAGTEEKCRPARYESIGGPRYARAAELSTTEFEQKLSKSGAPATPPGARRHAAARSRSTSYLANVLGGGHIPR